MLVIRNDQIKTLEEFALNDFENELVEHCKKFAPKHSEVIEESGVREVVRLGIKRAENYGLTNRGPVRFYVEMMFMFGSDFDTDFQMPWAGGVLNNEAIADQTQRADILHDKMLEYLEQVSGPDDKFSLDALRRMNQASAEDYHLTKQDFDRQMAAALRSIYPQKCEYLGEELLGTLIQRGKDLARSYSITSLNGTALMAALTLALGHGFAADPLFPWVSKTLADESIAEPNERAERLQKKMKIYLDQALKYLEERRNNV